MFEKKLNFNKDTYIQKIFQNVTFVKEFDPTEITVLAFITGIICCVFIIIQQYWIALLLFLLNRFLDNFDGYIARTYNKHSDFGAYLDKISDTSIYGLIIVSFWLSAQSLDYQSFFLNISALILLFIYSVNIVSISYLDEIVIKKEASTTNKPSLIVSSGETFIIYLLFFIFHQYLTIIFLLFAIAIFINVMIRLFWIYNFYKNS